MMTNAVKIRATFLAQSFPAEIRMMVNASKIKSAENSPNTVIAATTSGRVLKGGTPA